MIYKQASDEFVARMVDGLGYPHLKGLLRAWFVSKATSYDEVDIEIQYDYLVLYDEPTPNFRHFRIIGRDKKPIHNWMDMQEIKNVIWGEEVVAIEVFPAHSQFKDGSNTYHLWTWDGLKEQVPNLLKLYTYSE